MDINTGVSRLLILFNPDYVYSCTFPRFYRDTKRTSDPLTAGQGRKGFRSQLLHLVFMYFSCVRKVRKEPWLKNNLAEVVHVWGNELNSSASWQTQTKIHSSPRPRSTSLSPNYFKAIFIRIRSHLLRGRHKIILIPSSL